MKKILILAGILVFIITSCLKELFCLEGNGKIETQSRNALSINQIENTTSIDVVYKKANTVSITVKAESNLLSHIMTEATNGNLRIRTDPRSLCFNASERPLITITSPEIDELVLTGSGDFSADTISGNSFTISLTGSGDIFVDKIACDDLSAKITGSGDIKLVNSTIQNPDLLITGSGDLEIKGTADSGHLRITGSGDIKSGEFVISTAIETISGSGNIYTYVENSLTAVISGSGNIYLQGDPAINQTITGSGKIIRN